MNQLRQALEYIRNFLFSRTNREFLIFLFFLALSGIFWLLMTLNETYEQELSIPIRITNVPKDIVLTSDETDTVKVTIKDRGIILLTYLYGDALHDVKASFKTYDRGHGTGLVSSSELHRLILRELSGSSKLVSVKPDKVDFYYNTGASKKVPVRWSGRVIPEQLYFLSDVAYSPDSITVFAPEEKLDSIHMVYTEALNHVGFRDTLSVDCRLRRIEGVKLTPDHIHVTFFTDVLTEEGIDGIPVRGINLPPGKVLRTFPAKVRVKFVTGVNVYRTLSPNDFVVVADYNELKKNPSDKCNIYLQQMPHGISRASLEVKQVDYLIEEDGTKE